jgi:tRNA (uracil-5-)-methyltransferase
MGWGIARVDLDLKKDNDDDDADVDDHRKWIIMVPHVVVGELVKVSIFRNMKNFSEADLIEVVEPSPHRVVPKCALAGVCGGCQYQHMSIEAQREWKTTHCLQVLQQQQIKGYHDDKDKDGDGDHSEFEDLSKYLHPTLGTKEIYGYRSKLTPHYQAPTETLPDVYEMGAIGFQQSSNRNLVDVPECPIATAAINTVFQQTRIDLHQKAKEGLLNNNNNNQEKKKKKKGRKKRGGDTGATLLFRHADDDEDGNSVIVTDHNQYMTTTTQGIQFRYLAGNFFQNNNFVVPLMVDSVLEAVTKPTTASGNKKPLQYLIDCYCGSGLFALSAASKMKVCVGIELNQRAIEEATANAQLNGIENTQFVAASAEAIFTSPPTLQVGEYEHVGDFPRDETVVVLDPPRKGCSEEFLKQLYDYSPQRIVYMSCGPATQARDAKGIVEIGGYEITSIQPFDLFPQTKHVECLMIFEKKTVV